MRRTHLNRILAAAVAACALLAACGAARAGSLGLPITLSAPEIEPDALDDEGADADEYDFLFDSPSWALDAAQRGVWGDLAMETEAALESGEDDGFDGYWTDGALDPLAFADPLAFDAPSPFADPIFRGQVSPPVVSPTTESQNYGYRTYTYESANVNPPATMEDYKNNPTTIKRMFKYQQDLSGSFVYVPRAKNGIGLIEGGVRLFFAFPCQTFRDNNINEGVLAITPSFDYTNFQTPKHKSVGINLPKNVFDAGLTTSFKLSLNDFQGGVEVQVGVASTFKKITGKAIYVRGRAEGSLPVDDERKVRVLGGVGYYDRVKIKLLPIAGIVWTPNTKNELRIVFPDPMWGHFLTKVNETDWWFYVHGDIGGGRWLMSDPKHLIKGKRTYNFDYNDYRVGVGLRFDCPKGLKGSFEVGGAFGREIHTKAGKMFKARDSVYLSAGLFF